PDHRLLYGPARGPAEMAARTTRIDTEKASLVWRTGSLRRAPAGALAPGRGGEVRHPRHRPGVVRIGAEIEGVEGGRIGRKKALGNRQVSSQRVEDVLPGAVGARVAHHEIAAFG